MRHQGRLHVNFYGFGYGGDAGEKFCDLTSFTSGFNLHLARKRKCDLLMPMTKDASDGIGESRL